MVKQSQSIGVEGGYANGFHCDLKKIRKRRMEQISFLKEDREILIHKLLMEPSRTSKEPRMTAKKLRESGMIGQSFRHNR
ncbi:hypothetical protein LEP1GSC060_1296 [Leptospira weilii serovar Ranarum str. ICFT]|uniref:Uncharacterized protein n=1 Tax=Leptospira weilii serovar Ranarum str. ICFT TaxID=1218598 RepID=N1WUT0_9LEPT|nr:hypothetical protein LEP1GSC060_1296 [Leptospira weilii serovar Ranarum str. ICFT]